MTGAPRRSRKKILIGCVAFPLAGILVLCFGPRACFYVYKQKTKAEFRAHRAYYEGIVRQIESEGVPVDTRAFYIMSEDRYAGTMKKWPPALGDEISDAIYTGRTVEASNWKGVLTVKIAMSVDRFLGLPTQHGVVYCAGKLEQPSMLETFEPFEERWSYYTFDMAK